MGKSFPVGVDNFAELASVSETTQYYFVDKTRFIKNFWESGEKAILITRPRRFGKTLLLDMVKRFFDISNKDKNRALFENLLINQEHPEFVNEHCGQYPVIFLTLKTIKAQTYKEAILGVADRIARLIERDFPYIFNDDNLLFSEKERLNRLVTKTCDESELKNSLWFLSELLAKHHGQQVIILLDEYDSPIHDAFSINPPEKRYHEDLLNFMSSLIGQTFKGNDFLKKGLITGILHISHNNMFSGPNNIPSYTVMNDKYVLDFGFTEEEITDQLIIPSDIQVETATIRDWYNGYQFGEFYNVALYNPWSIIRCLSEQGKVDNYWVQSGEHGVIGEAVLNNKENSVLVDFQQLLLGKSIDKQVDRRMLFTSIQEDEIALWSLLVFSGYLKVIDKKFDQITNEELYSLVIPNNETRFIYKDIINNWFRKNLKYVYFSKLQKSLITGDVEEFKKQLSTYMNQTMSYFDFLTYDLERVYHVFVAGLLNGLIEIYALNSNKESGSGRYDFDMVPLNQEFAKQRGLYGVIIEFKSLDKPSDNRQLSDEKRRKKIDELSDKGLKQIHTEYYVSVLEQHQVEKVLLISLAFSGKEFSMQYEKYECMDYEKYKAGLLAASSSSKQSADKASSFGLLMTSGGIFADPKSRPKRMRSDDAAPRNQESMDLQ